MYFIEDILGKNLTFTHRTLVWENAIELIKKSPLLGYGLQSPDWFKYNLIYLTPHNMILLILIYGGFALLLSFIFIMISVIRKSKGYKGAYVNLLHFVLVDCLLMFSTETYQLVLIFLLFIYLGEIKLLNNVAVHNHYTA